MSPLRDQILETLHKLVGEWRESAFSPVFFDVPVEGELSSLSKDERREQFKDMADFVVRWVYEDIDHRLPDLAVLTGPLGSGKTIEACRIPERLKHELGGSSQTGAMLWIPCRRTVFYGHHVDMTIKENYPFESGSLWSLEADIRLVVLDGFDEALCRYDDPRALPWLRGLLDRCITSPSRPRVLLIGRDTLLDHSVIDAKLDSALRGFCKIRSPGASGNRLNVRMRAWKDAELRHILIGELRKKYQDQEFAERLVNRVGDGILSSPLLFGLAYTVLTNPQSVQDASPIPDGWALAQSWVETVLSIDDNKGYFELDAIERQKAAQEIALFLAVSGNGINGASEDEIRELNLKYGLIGVIPSLFDREAVQFRSGCLLKEQDGKFSPFHEGILVHLAAATLDRWKLEFAGAKAMNLESPSPLGELFDAWWKDPSDELVKGLPMVMERIGRILADSPAVFDNPLQDVFDYWIRHRWGLADGSTVSVPDLRLDRFGMDGECSAQMARAYEVLILFRNAILHHAAATSSQIGIRPVATLVPRLREYEAGAPTADIGFRDQLRELAARHSLNGPIEASDSGMIFVLNATLAEARRFRELTQQELLPDESWTCQFRPLRAYRIDHLHIDGTFQLVLDGLPSGTTLGSVVDRVLGSIRLESKTLGDKESSGGASVFRLDRNGSQVPLSLDARMEDYALVSNDYLRITIEGMNVLREETPVRPSPPVGYTIAIPPREYALPRWESGRGFAESAKLMPPLPTGQLPAWTIFERNDAGERQSFRRIRIHNLQHNVYLSAELVTVAEYAAFLVANPAIDVPHQPSVAWKRTGAAVSYREEYADAPATGMNHSDASQYVIWLGGLVKSKTKDEVLDICLPEPEWLQIAALGEQLENPPIDGSGRYGHRDLTGRFWQWTSTLDQSASEVLAFGGSVKLGDPAMPGSAQKQLMRIHPNLCRKLSPHSRDEHVGFRVCVIDRKV